MDYDVAVETLRHDRQYNLLNAEQRAIYESVLDSVDKRMENYSLYMVQVAQEKHSYTKPLYPDFARENKSFSRLLLQE